MNIPIQFASGIVGAAFGAGGVYVSMRNEIVKNRGDVNGLGRKYGRVIALLIRWADTEKKREQLADTVDPR